MLTFQQKAILAVLPVIYLAGRVKGRRTVRSMNVGRDQFLDILERAKAKGMTETEIAEQVGVSTSELRAVRSAAMASAREELVEQATELAAQGMPLDEVAKKLGLSKVTVRTITIEK